MGDKTMWREDCPKCKKEDGVECYDAPSCIQFSRSCDECGWRDGLDYYETGDNTIELLTQEEAKKRGLLNNITK
jgi:hypothetical protein